MFFSMTQTDYKYELFFELSPDLLCIAGYDGYFKKINSAVPKLLGYTMDELYARPINDFVHEEDKEITSKARKELTESRPLYNFENRYITKNGETVWLSWTSFPIDSEKLVFAVAKNITHKKRLEAERNSLLANLTMVNKDLKQLTYTTSHDLRSPVNNLLSILRLIDTSKITDPKTLELMSILKLSGDRLKETMNNYVDVLSEKHAAHVIAEQVDLQECLDNILPSISSLIETSGATIHADFSKLKNIRFNKGYMESIFLNLITNSIKYERIGHPPVIRIHSENSDRGSRLIFSDNGQGFDMEKVKDKIFGLHQKFHAHSDSKGIGLYLVHNHVTSFAGQIIVESKVNEGATFIITFSE